jgi:hypothetical protein
MVLESLGLKSFEYNLPIQRSEFIYPEGIIIEIRESKEDREQREYLEQRMEDLTQKLENKNDDLSKEILEFLEEITVYNKECGLVKKRKK